MTIRRNDKNIRTMNNNNNGNNKLDYAPDLGFPKAY